MEGLLRRLHQRVASLMSTGIVKASDEAGGTQLLQVAIGDRELHDNVPSLTIHGLLSVPLPGAQVHVLFQGGDRSNPVAIASGDLRFRIKSGAPGEIGIYDDLGQSIILRRSGIVVDGGGLPVKVINTPSVRMETTLNVTGDVVAGCDGAKISQLNHLHSGVQPGGGDTAKPVRAA